MNLPPADVAADYRRRGLYDLALATARAGTGGMARAEEARALTRLGRAAEALAVLDAAPAEGGNEAPVRLALLLARGEAELADGHARTARATLAEAVDVAGGIAPAPSTSVALALDLLASALLVAGEVPDGLGMAARAVAMAETLGAPADAHGQVLATLAEAHHRAGQWAAAEEAWREALALRRAYDPEHPDVAATLDGLGNTLRRRGNARGAVSAHRLAAPIHHARLGPLHPALAAHHHALAQALHRTGDFAGARVELERALGLSERRPGEDHPDTWVTRFELGRFEVDTGDVERGFARMEAARRRLVTLLGPDHPTVTAMARWL